MNRWLSLAAITAASITVVNAPMRPLWASKQINDQSAHLGRIV
jgi:hypothetical protein